MAKRKSKAKRSLGSLPKGLPSRKSNTEGSNPFEVTKRQRRPKHDVLNRYNNSANKKPSKLAESVARRQSALRASLQSKKHSSNSFVDRRIGEHDGEMTQEQQMMARMVRERSRRSKRVSKYSLDDDGDADDQPILTHKGKAINDMDAKDHIILSSDEEDGGNLDEIDTEMHFGGLGKAKNPYGSGGPSNMSDVYQSRKTELDDLIMRRKVLKAERIQSREKQVEAFDSMDQGFKELSQLLQFRDKQKERSQFEHKKRQGNLTNEEQEMADWDKEMKTYLYEHKRVKATDRTKTPEEIAKEEAERLQELETRRMARMNGDFEDDDFSDISDDEGRRKKKKLKKVKVTGAEALSDDSDNEDGADELKPRFTADGLVYLDKEGNIVKRAGDEESDDEKSEEDNDSDSDDESFDPSTILAVGTRVKGNYRIKEQYDGKSSWHDGKITQVNKDPKGKITYNVEYDDGDFEDDMDPESVRPVKKTAEEKEKEDTQTEEVLTMKRKRQKAKQKARYVLFCLEIVSLGVDYDFIFSRVLGLVATLHILSWDMNLRFAWNFLSRIVWLHQYQSHTS